MRERALVSGDADPLLRTHVSGPDPLRGARRGFGTEEHRQDLLQLEGPLHPHTRVQGTSGPSRHPSQLCLTG